jgi:putative glycosyltransferase (TIGR04372 family)
MSIKVFVVNLMHPIKQKLRQYFFPFFVINMFRWVFKSNYRSNNSIIIVSHKWYYNGAYFLAKYIYWVFSPLVKLLQRNKILFSMNNISYAVGHVYPEVDWLLRMKKVGLISKEKKIYYIYPKSPVLCGFVDAIGKDIEIQFILNSFIHILIYPLLIRYPEITVNASHSSMNHAIKRTSVHKYSCGKEVSYEEVFRIRQREYAKIRSITDEYYPLKNIRKKLTNELKVLTKKKKYFVIQIKENSVNSTWNPTDPNTYLDAINKMIRNGYSVVFAGREKMPSCFYDAGVVNYSESKYATAKNDYLIVLNSQGVLSSASGFSYIADVLDVPLLVLNNWQINTYPNKRTIYIPSRLQKNGRKLSFLEQMDYSYNHGQLRYDNKDISVESIDASSKDILCAYNELQTIIDANTITMPSILQYKFKNNLPLELTYVAQSNISNTYIAKNKDGF